MLSGNEIRQKFVTYFSDKLNHLHLPSSGLIPDNPTVLLTTAGMLQFVPIFLGYQNPTEPPRVVTYQKCARAGGKDSDIENVGRTPRHHTFFEMLGNFSFGDYFKKEIIPWAWEFVTKDLALPEEKLWITIYQDDDEAYDIWKNVVGIPEHKILRCGKKDNFWGPPGPTGPCGPCTEIHYDLGEHLNCGPSCAPSKCSCDRFVEIWNLVFMELYLDEDGNYTQLEKKNVDTGMGLERISMVVQGKTSTFETDLLKPILDKVCEITGKEYNKDTKTNISLRIITDHARCVTFLISDGLVPGNVGRNYVLRMILRRALRHGKILGIDGTFLHKIVDTIINQFKNAYPELEGNRDKVIDVIKTEEERFSKTIDRGYAILMQNIYETLETVILKMFAMAKKNSEIYNYLAQDDDIKLLLEEYKHFDESYKTETNNATISTDYTSNKLMEILNKVNIQVSNDDIINNKTEKIKNDFLISMYSLVYDRINKLNNIQPVSEIESLLENCKIQGKDAFTLYDTFGFPLELTVEITREYGIEVDITEFEKYMSEQKEKAKQAHVAESLTDELVYADILKETGPTKFVGYEQTRVNSRILKIIKDGKIVSSAQAGDLIELVIDPTPFYAESGGQIGDTGNLIAQGIIIEVINTTKYEDLFIHKCEIKEGEVKINSLVNAETDIKRRKDIACHHTATHLIHSALKKVLGNDVNQSGSMVAPDRARFDFSYNKALTFEELKQVEYWVNVWIADDFKRKVEIMRPEEAKAAGAIALFGEKYGDNVRVISYANISKELCGGTHIDNTGQILICKIVSETAIAAGVRRLELICGKYALELINIYEKEVHNLSGILKVPAEELTDRVEKIVEEMKMADKKIKLLNTELALSKVDNLINSAIEFNGYKLLSGRLDNIDSDALKSSVEKLSDKLGDSIVVLGSSDKETDKVTILVKVSDKLVKEGYNAGNIANKVASMCGGKGGGKPNFAQAGAKDPSRLNEALANLKNILKELIKA